MKRFVEILNKDSRVLFFIITFLFFGTLFAFTYVYAGYFSWNTSNPSSPSNWADVAISSDGSYLYALRDGENIIYRSTNDASTWDSSSVNEYDWGSIATSDTGQYVFVASKAGYPYCSTDYGGNFNQSGIGDQNNIWTDIAASSDGSKVVLVGQNTYINISDDACGSWSQADTTREWTAVAVSSDAQKIFVTYNSGGSGNLMRSTNSGSAFSDITPGAAHFSDIAVSSDGAKVAVVFSDSGVYVSDDSGDTWTLRTVISNLESWNRVTMSDDGKSIAVSGPGGHIAVSLDGGVNWSLESGVDTNLWTNLMMSGDGTRIAVTSSDAFIYLGIDNFPPSVSSVTSDKVNGTYGAGDVIDIDVIFSEPVTSTGNVTVTLETGTTDRTCTFSITNSATGTCNYIVQSGDSSLDLNVISVTGTIKDNVNNSLTETSPTTNLADNKDIVINTSSGSSGGSSGSGGWNRLNNLNTIYTSVNSITQTNSSSRESTSTDQLDDIRINNKEDSFIKVIYPPDIYNYIFKKDLEFGDRYIEDVRKLQKFLNKSGFVVAYSGPGSPGNETSIFGVLTRKAVIAFQKANNISPTIGYFGPITRGVVNSILAK